MRDQISFERARLLHPLISNEVIETISAIETAKFPVNISIRIVQGLRTFAEQQALYEQGRTKPGNKVTNSKAGQSYHCYGLALDFSLLIDGKISWDTRSDADKDGEADWMEVVDAFEGLQYVWGGRFSTIKDNPHLEKHNNIHWKELLRRYEAKEFIEGTSYVKL